jgi:hypothetical protein
MLNTEKLSNVLIEGLYNIYQLKIDALGASAYYFKFSIMEDFLRRYNNKNYTIISISNRDYTRTSSIGETFEYAIQHSDITYDIFVDMCLKCIDVEI